MVQVLVNPRVRLILVLSQARLSGPLLLMVHQMVLVLITQHTLILKLITLFVRYVADPISFRFVPIFSTDPLTLVALLLSL
jgi:hypothetical protein